MARPLDKHIDDRELGALVSWNSEGQKSRGLSTVSVGEAMRHVESCSICRERVSDYRQLVSKVSDLVISEATAPRLACPVDRDVAWHEVAAGLWPELKAEQLIMHAATCGHCGPRLRAATSVNDNASPEEEQLLAQLKTPSCPATQTGPGIVPPCPEHRPAWQVLLQGKVLAPIFALLLIVGASSMKPSSPASIGGTRFAELAADTHRDYVQGRLALDVHFDSQQMVDHWFEGKTQFAVTVPASPGGPGEEAAYHLKGARLVQVGGKAAAYIAYQMQSDPVSLVIVPESVAVASGGTQLSFKKVSFHYAMFHGYKVVTWSVHGLTYALVSKEGNRTQRSCMVCHSVMKDRDLSQTPTPLYSPRNFAEPISD